VAFLFLALYAVAAVISFSPSFNGGWESRNFKLGSAVAVAFAVGLVVIIIRAVIQSSATGECFEYESTEWTVRDLLVMGVIDSIRIGLLPILAALPRMDRRNTNHRIAWRLLQSFDLALEQVLLKAENLDRLVRHMVPKKILSETASLIEQYWGVAHVPKNLNKQDMSLPTELRQLTTKVDHVVAASFRFQASSSLVSLIGPTSLFRILRELGSVAESACARRGGRRVRLTQNYLLVAFGVDSGDEDATAHGNIVERALAASRAAKSTTGSKGVPGANEGTASPSDSTGEQSPAVGQTNNLIWRGLLSASDAFASLHILNARLGITISVSAALEEGPAVLTMGGSTCSAWDMLGRTTDTSIVIGARVADEGPTNKNCIGMSKPTLQKLVGDSPEVNFAFDQTLAAKPSGLPAAMLTGVGPTSQNELQKAKGVLSARPGTASSS